MFMFAWKRERERKGYFLDLSTFINRVGLLGPNINKQHKYKNKHKRCISSYNSWRDSIVSWFFMNSSAFRSLNKINYTGLYMCAELEKSQSLMLMNCNEGQKALVKAAKVGAEEGQYGPMEISHNPLANLKEIFICISFGMYSAKI